jgi:S-adenosylmethionine hydrolase
MPALVALLSDFGSRDWFVAAMKMVVLRHYPDAVLVDITHEVPPGDIRAGAFILGQCWREFPPGTVFLAVVDPGVGSARAGLVVNIKERLFVGPDNGLFSFPLVRTGEKPITRRLENPAWRPPVPSPTFHGRDIFAPAAGILASGTLWEKSGPIHPKPVVLSWPEPKFGKTEACGEIIHFDHFGNAITNLHRDSFDDVEDWTAGRLTLGRRRLPLVKTYAEVPLGQPLAYFGSSNFLEIGIRNGDARKNYKLQLGQMATLRWSY